MRYNLKFWHASQGLRSVEDYKEYACKEEFQNKINKLTVIV